MENGAQIQPAGDICGSKAVLSPRGDILMEDFRLENKPKNAITIAARIRLQETRGWHSIFSTAKTTDSGEIRGQFTKLLLIAKCKPIAMEEPEAGRNGCPSLKMSSSCSIEVKYRAYLEINKNGAKTYQYASAL